MIKTNSLLATQSPPPLTSHLKKQLTLICQTFICQQITWQPSKLTESTHLRGFSTLLLLLLCMFNLPANATSKFSASAYTIDNVHSDSSQKDYNLFGGYLYAGYNNHSLELAVDQLARKDDGIFQTEPILAYTWYGIPKTQIKLGTHSANTKITSSTLKAIKSSISANMWFVNVKRTSYNPYGSPEGGWGVSYYQTQHNSFQTFKANQFSVTLFDNIYSQSESGSGLVSLTYHANSLTNQKVDNKSSFYQFDLQGWYYWTYIVLGASYYWGDMAYGAKSTGFFLDNSGNRVKNGLKLQSTYYFNKTLSITGQIEQKVLKILSQDKQVAVSSTGMTVTLKF